MKIQFLGTGAAEGIPAMFCNCAFCKEAKRKGLFRSRTQILLDGELSLDFPPDAYFHMLRSGADFSALKYVLITHAHQDHFFAGDFILHGYKFAREMKEQELTILGNAETLEVFSESTRRELRPEIGKHLHHAVLSPFEEARFGDWRVYPLKAKHSSRDPLLFLLERGGKRVLHLHDTGPLPEEDYVYLAKLGGAPVDLVTLDCTFLYDRADENARHMGIYEDMEVLARLSGIGLVDGHTQKVISHFSHNGSPTAEKLRRAEEEYGVIAAYDGMELEI